jgi:type IV secretory pathway VirB10-like protein
MSDVPKSLILNPMPPRAVLARKAALTLVAIVGISTICVMLYLFIRPASASPGAPKPEEAKSMMAASQTAKEVVDAPRPLPTATPTTTGESQTATAPGLPRTQSSSHYNRTQYRQSPEPTEKEEATSWAYQQEQEAMAAPSAVAAANGGQSWAGPSTQSQTYPEGVPSARLAVSAQGNRDAFVEAGKAESGKTYLAAARVAPVSRFEVKAGTRIPVTLEQDVRSEFPGDLTGIVRTKVMDTATGKYLLIPSGSRLVGTSMGGVQYGQEGMAVIWTRVIFPDASSVMLGDMPAQDASGQAGLRDRVDNHYARLITMGFFISAFNAGAALSQSRRGSVLGYPSASETASTAVTQQLTQLGLEVTRKNLNIAPTIHLRTGLMVNVFVNKDILFEAPYAPMKPLTGR